VTIICKCGKEYKVQPVKCPDGNPGCLVWHGPAPEAYDCPACKTRNLPRIADGVREEIGMGTGNLAGIKRLELYSGSGS